MNKKLLPLGSVVLLEGEIYRSYYQPTTNFESEIRGLLF